MSRKLTAQYIFTVHDAPLKRAVIFVDDSLLISAISAPDQEIDTIERLEFYDGVFIPALIPCGDNKLMAQWVEFISFKGHRQWTSYYNIALSLFGEMKQKQRNTPFSEVLEDYTLKSSEILGLNLLGSLEPGKSPGILHIRNFDFKNLKLTEESSFEILMLPQLDMIR